MYDWNEAVRSLNVGLPDDIARLKAAGYYQEAIARIDRLLAEDWTKTQNGPASNGIAPPEGYVPPENPTPHGVDALREALTVQKEIMRRLPGEYCWTEAEAIARMQERVKDFTAEEFKKLDWEGRMDWRFVEGEKRYQARFAETLLATHADLAARKLTPDEAKLWAEVGRINTRLKLEMVAASFTVRALPGDLQEDAINILSKTVSGMMGDLSRLMAETGEP